MPKGRILVCCCGSVAGVKIPAICTMLAREGFEVKLVMTKGGRHFLESRRGDHGICPAELYNPQSWEDFRKEMQRGVVTVVNDSDDWATWSKLGDPILHIDLVKWADGLLIAPLSANTLARISGGLCDDLVTCIFRAWDIGRKPVGLCPAMNTRMWSHPLTEQHLKAVKRFARHICVIYPIEKELACGDTGVGALCELSEIAKWADIWVRLGRLY